MNTTSKYGEVTGTPATDKVSSCHDKESSLSHPPEALTDPQILRTIGLHLTFEDLGRCCYVSSLWRTIFSPFIFWIKLGELDAMMRKLETSNPANSLKKIDELYQARVTQLENLVKEPSAAFDFHSNRWRDLSSTQTKSPRSFLFMANLVQKTLRSLLYDHMESRMVRLDPQQFVDDLCRAVEGAGKLESLKIHECGMKNKFYSWADSLVEINEGFDPSHPESDQLKAWANARSMPCISMVPRRLKCPLWPQLGYITLSGLSCDHFFIRFLLSQAPALTQLTVEDCTILTLEETQWPDSDLKTIQRMFQIRDGTDSKIQDTTNANVKASLLIYLKLSKIRGVFWKDVLDLARQLPQLGCLTWEDVDEGFFQNLLPTSPSCGNCAVVDLNLTSAPLSDVIQLVKDCKHLFFLTLEKIKLDLTLVRVLALRAWTLSSISLTNCSMEGGDEALVLILCSMFSLEHFSATGLVMKCDPLWLKTPWVCKELQYLSVSPKCDGGDYTADMAQEAFMTQVARLPKLQTLNFMGGAGVNEFHPEKSLGMLKDLKELRRIDLKSASPESGVVLTLEHAKLVVESWPKLKRIAGLPKTGLEPFKNYLKKHRPEIDTGTIPRRPRMLGVPSDFIL
ncbi:hypothetical protein EMPS_07351 [Entomortierella parvispora]|uniref:F-box domain-containing protein n=1 Tax=Entomortierella parvispora TaxID=205924 RepID=A0A9P3LYC8_9FUNG|nr:hypothetical protein EMPS_07351 [Entomortierella parvispora]